jgi:hypothetical protein
MSWSDRRVALPEDRGGHVNAIGYVALRPMHDFSLGWGLVLQVPLRLSYGGAVGASLP